MSSRARAWRRRSWTWSSPPRSQQPHPRTGADLLEQAFSDLLDERLHVGLRRDLAIAQLQVDAGDEWFVARAQYLVEEVVRLVSRRAAARA